MIIRSENAIDYGRRYKVFSCGSRGGGGARGARTPPHPLHTPLLGQGNGSHSALEVVRYEIL